MSYRVFVGYWGNDGPLYRGAGRVDESGLSWEQARAKLAYCLGLFRDDDCNCCRTEGLEALSQLNLATPGHFQAEVDGSDYLIFAEQPDAVAAPR